MLSTQTSHTNRTSLDLCGWMTDIALGSSAQALHESNASTAPSVPAGHRLHVLPVHLWLRPVEGRAGRKGADGSLHPVRVQWTGGPVHLVRAGEEKELTWTARGLGHDLAGTCTLVDQGCDLPARSVRSPSCGSPADGTFDSSAAIPKFSLPATPADPGRISETLDCMQRRGQDAWWQALGWLESWSRKLADTQNVRVASEIADRSASGVLDSAQLDETVSALILGHGGKPGRVWRALERASCSMNFPVDPVRYLLVETRRCLDEAIRHRIGDPHIGPKVRRIARRMCAQGASFEELLDEYNRLYPGDCLGPERAAKALTAAPRLEARFDTVSLDELAQEGGWDVP